MKLACVRLRVCASVTSYNNSVFYIAGGFGQCLVSRFIPKTCGWPNLLLRVGKWNLLPAGFHFHQHCRGACIRWDVILHGIQLHDAPAAYDAAGIQNHWICSSLRLILIICASKK